MHAWNDAVESTSDNELRILLVTDPGFTERMVRRVTHRVEARLAQLTDDPVSLTVERSFIQVAQDNTLDVEAAEYIAREHTRVDAVVLVTEMPRHVEGTPVVADVFADPDVSVVSLPALGLAGLRRHLTNAIVESVVAMEVPGMHGGRVPRALPWADWVEGEDGGRRMVSHGVRGSFRLMKGMVLMNEPWRTAPQMSSVLAAAAATGAFGIFYSSIWQMSDALSWWRLLVTGLIAITVMVAWLLLSNRLVDSPESQDRHSVVALYNLSTIVTLTLCVVALYAVLFCGILAGAVVVIAPNFMSDVLGYPADFPNYLKIAWFSAAMGVIAGALGSSFDSSTDVRSITHGQRERQRRIEAGRTGDRHTEAAGGGEQASRA